MVQLTFLGAARTVTGSKYLLEHDARRVLVDCGLFQGLKELRLRNWAPFPVPPASIDAVVLTHAHLDHVGYLPRLYAQGFKATVLCTAGTVDSCGLVLPDSGRVQEEDARFANKHRFAKHEQALPLYGEDDARCALKQLQSAGYDTPVEVAPGITVTFSPAGRMSAHADRGEIVRRLKTLPKSPARVCLVHDEDGPMDALRALVTDRFGWKPYMPAHGERIGA